MNDNLLEAVCTAVRMKRGAYTWKEAFSYCVVQYGLDEYQEEDLQSLARNQYRRLINQMEGKR